MLKYCEGNLRNKHRKQKIKGYEIKKKKVLNKKEIEYTKI